MASVAGMPLIEHVLWRARKRPRCLLSPAPPSQEFTVELLGLLRRLYSSSADHKLSEFRLLLRFGLVRTPISQPFLGGRKTVPSRNACSQVHRLPKWVTRRLVKLLEFREGCIDELCRPLVSHRVFCPVEWNQDGEGCDRGGRC